MIRLAYYIFLWAPVTLAVGCGRSLAVLIGTAWIDSRGGFHWRGE